VHVPHAAVPGPVPGLEVLVAPGHDALDVGPGLFGPLRGLQVHEGEAGEGLPVVAQLAAGLVVEHQDAARAGVQHHDAVGPVLEEGAVAGLALPQGPVALLEQVPGPQQVPVHVRELPPEGAARGDGSPGVPRAHGPGQALDLLQGPEHRAPEKEVEPRHQEDVQEQDEPGLPPDAGPQGRLHGLPGEGGPHLAQGKAIVEDGPFRRHRGSGGEDRRARPGPAILPQGSHPAGVPGPPYLHGHLPHPGAAQGPFQDVLDLVLVQVPHGQGEAGGELVGHLVHVPAQGPLRRPGLQVMGEERGPPKQQGGQGDEDDREADPERGAGG